MALARLYPNRAAWARVSVRRSKRARGPADPSAGEVVLPLACRLQACASVSRYQLVAALLMERRWQLGRDCLDCESASIGKARLVRFRAALIEEGLDRRLSERTLEVAELARVLGPGGLRAAL